MRRESDMTGRAEEENDEVGLHLQDTTGLVFLRYRTRSQALETSYSLNTVGPSRPPANQEEMSKIVFYSVQTLRCITPK